MSLRNSLFILLSAVSLILAGCGGTEGPANSNTANTANANTANVARANASNAVAVTTPTPDQVTNNAPTLTPVYKAYCAAVVKKDEAAIRRFYTADTLKSFEETMKEDNVKTLSEFLKDDKISNEMCEVANERIKGDKAVAKVRTPAYPNGYEVLFIKENGEWKMSNISPEKGFQ
jgi:predicted lipid-binding transport protein (Tim44 family)